MCFLSIILKKEALAQDEFFAELRIKGISQLGQIEEAIEEVSGEISVFYFPDEAVQYGLPIMPDSFNNTLTTISEPGYYSCIFCGYTEKLKPVQEHKCPTCEKKKWIKASNKKRVT